MKMYRPDLFFCESAWEGGVSGWPDWRGRIYHNHELYFENRKVLLELLAYCRKQKIPTVFWDKENPAFWGHPRYDFAETAVQFDFIFTTAEECVDRYRFMGHENTFILPFGVNTDLFFSPEIRKKFSRVIFAGSWYENLPNRCRALEVLFDHVLSQGMELDIYNRKSGKGGKNFSFPSRYQPFLRDGVAYTELPALLRKYEYALNVNTITDSQTMCSRRVLQLAASGMKIITNPSPAMDRMEGLRLYKLAEDDQVCYWKSDAQIIARKYSVSRQFKWLLEQTLGSSAAGRGFSTDRGKGEKDGRADG